ncbi:hypothetical protein ACRALDRAFT_1071868 [Sodiomyces alcalophilus JCM 7366]|uniref:uncharacterized protein n=1 Tax=Sodiomyces alcalophilus JCM 7366 TaxID=591952 RepID=UPI0039B53E0D
MDTPEDALSYISPIVFVGFSYYGSTSSMSAAFYQDLLDRHWRRSGSLLYRPNQRQSCCPHYTIRLDSALFKPTRDQRQAVNRFNRHVIGSEYAAAAARLYPKSRAESKKRETEFDLVERIREAEQEHLKTPPEPAHRYTVTLEEDSFTEEKFLVYENYQRVVHKEGPSDISRRGFRRFLCDSPIRREVMTTPEGKQLRLGSYHQCYRLDGKLVAIGVLDLLPHCVSSVYFLYHESIHKFMPGKLGALKEIALAKEAGYRYWYPGFYIHSCPKMRYKIDYMPQYILDPETLQWDPIDEHVLTLLDKSPYVSLSAERRAKDGGGDGGGTDEDPGGSEGVADKSGSESDGDEPKLLFDTDMPGITSRDEIAEMDLDHIALRLDKSGPLFTTSDLVIWDSQSVSASSGIKARVAELLAAIGPDLKDSLCLDFS